jgi:hypothetical protein
VITNDAVSMVQASVDDVTLRRTRIMLRLERSEIPVRAFPQPVPFILEDVWSIRKGPPARRRIWKFMVRLPQLPISLEVHKRIMVESVASQMVSVPRDYIYSRLGNRPNEGLLMMIVNAVTQFVPYLTFHQAATAILMVGTASSTLAASRGAVLRTLLWSSCIRPTGTVRVLGEVRGQTHAALQRQALSRLAMFDGDNAEWDIDIVPYARCL